VATTPTSKRTTKTTVPHSPPPTRKPTPTTVHGKKNGKGP
jgi:hypothetical protein